MNEVTEFYLLACGLQPNCKLEEGWQFKNFLGHSSHVVADIVPKFDGAFFGDILTFTSKLLTDLLLEYLLGELVFLDVDQTSQVPYFLYLVIERCCRLQEHSLRSQVDHCLMDPRFRLLGNMSFIENYQGVLVGS